MWRLAVLSVAAISCSSSGDGRGADAGRTDERLTTDEAIRACVMWGSCLYGGIDACFNDVQPRWSMTEARCLVAAQNCAAAQACFGMTVVTDLTCNNTTSKCVGTSLELCSSGARTTVQCADASPLFNYGTGPTCVDTATMYDRCGVVACSTASKTCDGNVATRCDPSRGLVETIDCAKYGQTCVNGECNAPGGNGTCTPGTLPSCDGTTLVQCLGSVERRVDCARVVADATCITTPSLGPYCGFASACYSMPGGETCNGSAVTFCAGGTPTTVDCTSYGFAGCFDGRCM